MASNITSKFIYLLKSHVQYDCSNSGVFEMKRMDCSSMGLALVFLLYVKQVYSENEAKERHMLKR